MVHSVLRTPKNKHIKNKKLQGKNCYFCHFSWNASSFISGSILHVWIMIILLYPAASWEYNFSDNSESGMMFLCILWKSTPWASLACTSKFDSELAKGWDSLHLLLTPGQIKYIIPPAEQLNGFCGELETNSYGKIALCPVTGSAPCIHTLVRHAKLRLIDHPSINFLNFGMFNAYVYAQLSRRWRCHL